MYDKEVPFITLVFKELLKINYIAQTHNLICNLQNSVSIGKSVRLLHQMDAWPLAYSSTPHSIIKVSSAELFLAKRLRIRLSLLRTDNIFRRKI